MLQKWFRQSFGQGLIIQEYLCGQERSEGFTSSMGREQGRQSIVVCIGEKRNYNVLWHAQQALPQCVIVGGEIACKCACLGVLTVWVESKSGM